MSVNSVLAALESHGCEPKRRGGAIQARCPAHDDGRPSLSVSVTSDSKVLLKCHAGCITSDIVAKLGLTLRDLFPNGEKRPTRPQARPPRTTTITVEDLARDKALPAEFLHSVGLKNTPNGVEITYRMKDGSLAPRQRLRTALEAKEGSIWLPGEGSPIPYGLWRLKEASKAGSLTFVEGESDALTAWHHEIPAIGIPGATMCHALQAEHLEGIERLFAVQEPDQGGLNFIAGVGKQLHQLKWAGSAFVMMLPAGVKDLNALHKKEPDGFTAAVRAMLKDARPLNFKESNAEPAVGRSRGKITQAELLLLLAEEVELFHTPEGEAHVTFQVGGHQETWPIKGRAFRHFLILQFYQEHEKPPHRQAVQNALDLLEARAVYDGGEKRVYVRLAEQGGRVYLDLGNAEWEVVEIGPEGWKIARSMPVKFLRPRGVLPLPRPVPGGTVNELRPFVNFASEDDWILLRAWLVNSLRPRGPYPVLVFLGEQGSAKSTVARVLRSLCDPNVAPLRAEPREVRDLMIAATNGWVVSLDNMSHLRSWLSDAVCRLATGGGFSTRELYTNREEALFDAQRPVILNGINEIVTRGDLMDRSIILSLPNIAPERCMDEKKFWSEFENVQPLILGALLDSVSMALRELPTVKLAQKPRMADFAVWVSAAEPALGWGKGSFLRAYTGNREAANETVLENSLVAAKVRALKHDFEGTAAELLETLNTRVSEEARKQKRWPKTPRGLSGALRRLAPNLRRVGVDVIFGREETSERRRMIRIRKTGHSTVQTVHTVRTADARVERAGVRGDEAGRSPDANERSFGRSPDDLGVGLSAHENILSDGSDGSDTKIPARSSETTQRPLRKPAPWQDDYPGPASAPPPRAQAPAPGRNAMRRFEEGEL